MFRPILSFVLFSTLAAADYKMESGGPPPSEIAPEIAQALQKQGVKVLEEDGSTLCEFWFRTALPSGPPVNEPSVTLPKIPHGALLGVIHYLKNGADHRGQQMKPGFYTMRFSFYPIDGAHQGVAPQRDFIILSLAEEDKDLNATPAFDPLMDMSRKAARTQHPACLGIWKADVDFKAGFDKMGESDWVYQTKIGDTPVAFAVISTPTH